MNQNDFQKIVLKAAMFKAFEAGRARGRCECNPMSTHVPDFENWYAKEMKLNEQTAQEGQESK